MARKLPEEPEAISATRLGAKTDLSERQVSRICALHSVPKVTHHGFQFWPAISALVNHYRNESENLDEETKRHKAAIIANERRQSDIETGKMEGDYIETSQVIRTASAYVMAARQRILSSSLSGDEREAVLKDLEQLGSVNWVERAKELTLE
jgi:hypothetical protein